MLTLKSNVCDSLSLNTEKLLTSLAITTSTAACKLDTGTNNTFEQNSIKISEREYLKYYKRANNGLIKYQDVVNYGRRINDPLLHNCVMCGQSNVPIPCQNKDVCKECDTLIWYNKGLNVLFKFCKGCKNFNSLEDFSDKPEASKCCKCRKRGRENYLNKKVNSSDISDHAAKNNNVTPIMYNLDVINNRKSKYIIKLSANSNGSNCRSYSSNRSFKKRLIDSIEENNQKPPLVPVRVTPMLDNITAVHTKRLKQKVLSLNTNVSESYCDTITNSRSTCRYLISNNDNINDNDNDGYISESSESVADYSYEVYHNEDTKEEFQQYLWDRYNTTTSSTTTINYHYDSNNDISFEEDHGCINNSNGCVATSDGVVIDNISEQTVLDVSMENKQIIKEFSQPLYSKIKNNNNNNNTFSDSAVQILSNLTRSIIPIKNNVEENHHHNTTSNNNNSSSSNNNNDYIEDSCSLELPKKCLSFSGISSDIALDHHHHHSLTYTSNDIINNNTSIKESSKTIRYLSDDMNSSIIDKSIYPLLPTVVVAPPIVFKRQTSSGYYTDHIHSNNINTVTATNNNNNNNNKIDIADSIKNNQIIDTEWQWDPSMNPLMHLAMITEKI